MKEIIIVLLALMLVGCASVRKALNVADAALDAVLSVKDQAFDAANSIVDVSENLKTNVLNGAKSTAAEATK